MSELKEQYKLVLDTIKKYPNQLRQAWEEINELNLPENFKNPKNVVVCGMGGSALGARMVDSLIFDEAGIPIEIFNQYHVPNYVNKETFFISYSYSGNTEEAVSCLNEAIKKDAKIFGITTGGNLETILTANNLEKYIFKPENNPSGQPRMAVGYSVGAIMALFSKLNISKFSDSDIDNSISAMKNAMNDFGEDINKQENQSKMIAKKIHGKGILIVASEHLVGTAHTIKNQLNESAKTFSALFELPELNHHLLEGLKNPKSMKKEFIFLFINSNLYSDRVQKRYPLTQEVIKKNGYQYEEFIPSSNKKIEQLFETLVFGSLVSYYLSKNYGINPNEIPWVDYFKQQLEKP